MNLLISAIEAAGTFAIAVIAIWGDWLKSKLFPPGLRIELSDPHGENDIKQDIWQNGELVQQQLEACYYHLRLSNDKKFAVAHEAQVMITRIENEGPDGQPRTIYSVALPLTWRNQQTLDPRAWRTVGGQSHDADLLYVRRDGLFLAPMVMPNNFPGYHPSGQRVVFWVTVQARSVETESKAIRFQIAWDGAWEPGEAEMATHLVISEA